ncbi:branched-chain amino acid transport system permease protein [Breznakia sp. PF5-3]|uniref:branched-chain amino acid ABC transporter permease n=1 Tax=unclassified Breznakia TaxID=2623764 RepID=UPI0024055F5B|nr:MULTISPECIES: branched-chain amino acid ABC transporter permease [unclassified Breznakia]MDF9824586.1 branched-chain amino acid transport system permease protein [Breznakia sp. PM6-1]MDF9835476.1 branched-chain amino acid transport system permease protein [Breznakia sp. PF5-3]MDF9837886.1 branched-chain amino acid transport system permease protein [Breznakia sp. PFB2-8]MDF9859821.1 branched-chain amino acid transport system permease protein [Breznakia sp. PH5-24]
MKHLFTKKNLMWLLFGALICIAMYFVFGVVTQKWQKTLITAAYYIIGALGLNLIIGVSGQFSLGHAGFIAIGAYSVGVVFQGDATLANFALGIAIGVVITCAVALIIAVPTFRLRGDYLAIATLGFSEIIRIAIQNMKITGGASGLSYLSFENINDHGMFLMMLITIVLSILLIVNFVKSSHGRATISVREDEIASEAMGVNTTKYKTIAFLIGASLAAIAGAYVGPMNFFIKPGDFGFQKSIDVLVIVVLGGMGSLSGTVIAGIFIAVINTLLQNYSDIRMILYAIILVTTMIFRPKGLFGNKEITDIFSKKRKEAE